MFKTFVLPILVFALIPTVFRLIVRLHLLPPLVYAIIAQAVYSEWALVHPIISKSIFVVLACYTVLR